MKRLFLLSVLLLTPAHAATLYGTFTCVGTLTSKGLNPGYYQIIADRNPNDNDMPMTCLLDDVSKPSSKKILAVCQEGDKCIVRASGDSGNANRHSIDKVLSVRHALNAQAKTVGKEIVDNTSRQEIIDAVAGEYGQAAHDCRGVALCLRAKVHDASDTLANTYNGVEKSLRSNPKQTAGLRASQQAWSNFVKMHCEFLGSVSNNAAEVQACMLHYILTRALELHTYIGWD